MVEVSTEDNNSRRYFRGSCITPLHSVANTCNNMLKNWVISLDVYLASHLVEECQR